MVRAKEFDPDAALRGALELFWRRGYEATSIRDLEEHLGIGRASIYATFGTKHELYLRALDRYCEEIGGWVSHLLAQPGSALAGVRAVVTAFAEQALNDPQQKGCLITNTAVECLPGDDLAARRVDAGFTGLESSLAGALLRAQEQGELSPDRDVAALARFLFTFLQGIRVSAKSPDERRIRDAVDQAMVLLN